MNNDSIEFSEDPYRSQLERTLDILEIEVKQKNEVCATLKEATTENKLLSQSCIEQRNVIQDLKMQIEELMDKQTRDECLATDETNESIQLALDKLKPFREMYQDLYPALSKLVIQDTIAREETEYDENTVDKIMAEVYGEESSKQLKLMDEGHSSGMSGSQDNSEPLQSPLIQKDLSTEDKGQANDLSGKKGFDWGIFKKFTSNNKEKEQSLMPNTPSDNSASKEKPNQQPKAAKEWELIQSLLLRGESIWSMRAKIETLFKAGSFVPHRIRGAVWKRLIGNRSRITPRIYQMLLLQLPNANPEAKQCILKDMPRSFTFLSGSETLEKVRKEAIKILQLFEVAQFN